MRLHTAICSKTHLCSEQRRTCPVLRDDDFAGKGSHRNGPSSPEQPLIPRPQKGWRPLAHPRSQTPESCPHEEVIQDDHAEADPLANSHRGLVLFSGPERRILSIQFKLICIALFTIQSLQSSFTGN